MVAVSPSPDGNVAWFTHFCLHFSSLLVQKGAFLWEVAICFLSESQCNGLTLPSRVVLSVLLTPCKLSYLCTAPETYKITQQMRELLSVLARHSGSQQLCGLTRSFWLGTGRGVAGVGRVGRSRSNTDGINVRFVFRFVDWLICLFLFSCFCSHRTIAYLWSCNLPKQSEIYSNNPSGWFKWNLHG